MNLAKLAEFGIKATVTQAGKLHLEALEGTLTPELRQEIAQNREFLLAEMNMMNFMNIKSSCIGSHTHTYTGCGNVHVPGKPGFDELHEHDELQNHLYGLARAHIYPESHVHQQAANDPDSTPAAVLDPDRHAWPHTEAMNTAEISAMSTRLETFNRIGMDVDQAEKLADKLLTRDHEGDDRAMCLECANLTGGTGNWRCMAFRQRGARDPGLPHDMIDMLTRCPTFVAGEPSTSSSYTPARPANDTRLVQRDRAQGPWLTASETAAAQEYHQHHATCPQCQAAGRGHVSHCSAGADLWTKYQSEDGKNV